MPGLRLQVATPESKTFDNTVDKVSLPTALGEITILPNHEPLVALLRPGELRFTKNNEEQLYAVDGGFVAVQENTVVVLADAAVHAADIDEKLAIEAKERAERIMKEKVNDEQFAEARAVLERSLAQLRAVQKIKRRHRETQ